MGQWVESPRLIEASSGRVLFDLAESSWSIDVVRWMSDDTVEMEIRRYPGDHSPAVFQLGVDCRHGVAVVAGEGAVRLPSLLSDLEAIYSRRKRR